MRTRLGTLFAAAAVLAGGIFFLVTDQAKADVVAIPFIVTGPGPGGGPHVRVFNADGSPNGPGFFAYDAGFTGGVDVAAGDLDGDGVDEIVTGAGPGGGPHVKVFSLNGDPLSGFFAYDPGFKGGVNVAVGQVDDDPELEIITGAGPGGGPHVRAFDLDGTPKLSFFAERPEFTVGIDVTAIWPDTDATEQRIVTAGQGGAPYVNEFESDGTSAHISFLAYGQDFRGGVSLGAADLNGDGKSEIVAGPGPGGGPHVKAFDAGNGAPFNGTSFFAYGAGFGGGVNVGGYLPDPDATADAIVTGAGPGGGPHVRGFNANGGPNDLSFFAYGPSFGGGVHVAGAVAIADVPTSAS